MNRRPQHHGRDRRSGAEALYRLLLYAYPRRFRELYAGDMLDYFHDRRADLASRPLLARSLGLFKDIAGDLLRSVPREHFEARRTRGGRSCTGATPPRGPRGDSVARQFISDMSLAVRTLANRPTFALTVVVTLALGIGANAAVFSLVNGVLLAPLPYPEADRLVRIFERNSPTNTFPMSVADYQGIELRQRSLESVAALRRGTVTVTGGELPEQAAAVYVTARFFDVLGVLPAEGRGFRAGEDVPGAGLVVVLGAAIKERHFGSAVDAVGRAVTLNARSYTVVGVMPPGVGDLAGYPADVWPILQLEAPPRRGPFFLVGVGRLAENRSVADATVDLARVSEELFPLWADTFQDETVKLIPLSLRESIVGDAGNALAIVFGAVAFVLLVAVANVANLMMTRASGRHREMAVRAALGATRGRLARWLLAESLVLATLGGVLGVAIAVAGVEAFKRASFGLPRLDEVAVDGWAIVFTAAIVLLSGVFFGSVPLLLGAAGSPADDLKAAARGASAGRRAGAFRSGLVVSEFALTLPLLIAAGLLVNSLTQLQSVDPGFNPDGVVAMRIGLPASTYGDQSARRQFWSEAMAEAGEIPGVVTTAVAAGLPPDAPNEYNNFDLLDKPVEPGQSQPVSPWSYVTADFFDSLQVPVLEGRAFDEAIDTDGAPVVVVSRTWSDRFYPGDTAVGKQMVSGGCTECDPTTIVGIVGDVKYRGLAGDGEAMYQPAYQYWPSTMSLVVKAEGPMSATLGELRRRLRALDPDLPLNDAATMEERLHASIAQPRHWATLLVAFAAAALMLSAVGIFGVLSYSVRRQTREIGVRMALGADAGSVLGLVLRRGMTHATVGVVVGLAVSLYATRWLESMLFGVVATDPLTLGAVCTLLLLVAFVACYLPGRRAAKIDPIEAITQE